MIFDMDLADFLYMILAFATGLIMGLVVHFLLDRLTEYSGVMLIDKSEERTTYSLELHDDPVNLEYKQEIIFKVKTSD